VFQQLEVRKKTKDGTKENIKGENQKTGNPGK
jgi:hypothetical protein